METKRQMISLFSVCTPVCPDTVWESWYRFCMQQEQENHFWKEFRYQEYLDRMKEFLKITKVEVNLLPYDQTFNYNVNCIAASNGAPEGTRRQRGASVAKEENLLVIEDGINNLLEEKPLPPIASFAPEWVVYISSLSKTISPGLRTAFVYVPDKFHEKLVTALYSLNNRHKRNYMLLETLSTNRNQFPKGFLQFRY